MARQLTHAGETVAFLGLLDTAASREHAGWKRYVKYAGIFRRRPAATSVRYTRALARRALWLARWIRNKGRQPFVPEPSHEALATNRLFEALGMHRALKPYAGRSPFPSPATAVAPT